jgi:hypothetical protein
MNMVVDRTGRQNYTMGREETSSSIEVVPDWECSCQMND